MLQPRSTLLQPRSFLLQPRSFLIQPRSIMLQPRWPLPRQLSPVNRKKLQRENHMYTIAVTDGWLVSIYLQYIHSYRLTVTSHRGQGRVITRSRPTRYWWGRLYDMIGQQPSRDDYPSRDWLTQRGPSLRPVTNDPEMSRSHPRSRIESQASDQGQTSKVKPLRSTTDSECQGNDPAIKVRHWISRSPPGDQRQTLNVKVTIQRSRSAFKVSTYGCPWLKRRRRLCLCSCYFCAWLGSVGDTASRPRGCWNIRLTLSALRNMVISWNEKFISHLHTETQYKSAMGDFFLIFYDRRQVRRSRLFCSIKCGLQDKNQRSKNIFQNIFM